MDVQEGRRASNGDREALVVMDVQRSVIATYGDGVLPAINSATTFARSIDMPVIYFRAQLRAGYPEVVGRNKRFREIARVGRLSELDSNSDIHPAVAPRDGDIVITKRRVGAFSGTDFSVLLRGLDVTALTLVGMATSGCVLSTLFQAADLDFALTVLADCCTDRSTDVQRILMEEVFPHQADVMSLDQWIASRSQSLSSR